MSKLFVSLAAASGLLAVVFGAFGAHALKGKLDAYALGVFETAVQYQFYHALALLAVGVLLVQLPDASLLRSSGWLFVTGTVIFSGSLYILSLKSSLSLSPCCRVTSTIRQITNCGKYLQYATEGVLTDLHHLR